MFGVIPPIKLIFVRAPAAAGGVVAVDGVGVAIQAHPQISLELRFDGLSLVQAGSANTPLKKNKRGVLERRSLTALGMKLELAPTRGPSA